MQEKFIDFNFVFARYGLLPNLLQFFPGLMFGFAENLI